MERPYSYNDSFESKIAQSKLHTMQLIIDETRGADAERVLNVLRVLVGVPKHEISGDCDSGKEIL